MTTKIYSKLDPSKLLHMIVREVPDGRTNLCEDEHFLQCAVLKLPRGTTFKTHRHISKTVPFIYPDESWCVLEGSAIIMMFDTDGAFLGQELISKGEFSFTFNGGGHNYEVVTDNFHCAEYKTGPYRGIEADKIFINA